MEEIRSYTADESFVDNFHCILLLLFPKETNSKPCVTHCC